MVLAKACSGPPQGKRNLRRVCVRQTTTTIDRLCGGSKGAGQTARVHGAVSRQLGLHVILLRAVLIAS